MARPSDLSDLSSRQVAVARAYVQGLEADRVSLHDIEEKLSQTVWEVVQLGSLNRALYRALRQLSLDFDSGRVDTVLLDRIDGLLEKNVELASSIWMCACGHSKYDHDERGCQFLGCAPICGES